MIPVWFDFRLKIAPRRPYPRPERPRYQTRLQTRKMSNEEPLIEDLDVQAEITGMKIQMSKILEMLTTLTTNQSAGSSVLANPAGASSQPPVLTGTDPENPSFGLPRNFLHHPPTSNETFTFPMPTPPMLQPPIMPNPQPIFITSNTPPLSNPIAPSSGQPQP